MNNTHNSQVLNRPRLLNILQRPLQILQLLINFSFRLFRTLDCLGFKSLNGFHLSTQIISGRFEPFHSRLDFVNDALILELRSVLCKVHA